MKSIVKNVFKQVIRLIHFFFNLSTFNFFSLIWCRLYSQWISFEFKECGENFLSFGLFKLCGAKYISIGDNVSMGLNVVLEATSNYRGQHFSPSIVIGNDSSFQDDCHITCINKIIIGNHVRIGRRCLLSDNAHGASDIKLLDMDPRHRPLVSKGAIVIEDNVWLGEMCCVMPGVTIGHGSIIGANAVVTKDVPPYSIVVGPSGKVIKTLG